MTWFRKNLCYGHNAPVTKEKAGCDPLTALRAQIIRHLNLKNYFSKSPDELVLQLQAIGVESFTKKRPWRIKVHRLRSAVRRNAAASETEPTICQWQCKRTGVVLTVPFITDDRVTMPRSKKKSVTAFSRVQAKHDSLGYKYKDFVSFSFFFFFKQKQPTICRLACCLLIRIACPAHSKQYNSDPWQQLKRCTSFDGGYPTIWIIAKSCQ